MDRFTEVQLFGLYQHIGPFAEERERFRVLLFLSEFIKRVMPAFSKLCGFKVND